MSETRWRPRHPRTMLVAPLDASGMRGGIAVAEDARRNKMQAYVLATRDCLEVEPGDIVMYDEGVTETLKTADGEVLAWLAERNVNAIDDELWPKPAPEAQTASGLFLPARG